MTLPTQHWPAGERWPDTRWQVSFLPVSSCVDTGTPRGQEVAEIGRNTHGKKKKWAEPKDDKEGEGGRGRQYDMKRKKVEKQSCQLSGEEEVVLPGHHHADTLALPGAAQHGHQLLLAATRHVNPIHLQAHRVNTQLSSPCCSLLSL